MIPVIAIFDIGKTNKKVILFDRDYKIVFEESKQFAEVKDEDEQPCDDIQAITQWIRKTIEDLLSHDVYEIKAFNVSAYGASFVHLDRGYNVITPVYNYLNSYPKSLLKDFYDSHGEEQKISKETASPALGNLNSGLQLFRLKYEKPAIFSAIAYSLHLPQYISFVISSIACTDMTSIGCHTYLWDFEKNSYHFWVLSEGLIDKFPAIVKGDNVFQTKFKNGVQIPVGTGLHDSSAALIPYLATFDEPFILLSTGTWCISLNPFNYSPLTHDELGKDCLCYLTHLGNPVKASRLFAGSEHETQVRRLAEYFRKDKEYYKQVSFDETILAVLRKPADKIKTVLINGLQRSDFEKHTLSSFGSYEEAYHQLMVDIIELQKASTELILTSGVRRIFVDGGFSRNDVYMNLLARSFPRMEVFGAAMPQSTSLGAAMVIHKHWNSQPIPQDLIKLKSYPIQDSQNVC